MPFSSLGSGIRVGWGLSRGSCVFYPSTLCPGARAGYLCTCCTWTPGDPPCLPTHSTLGGCGQTEDWHWTSVLGRLQACPVLCIWRQPQVPGTSSPISVPVLGPEQPSPILPRTLNVRSELPQGCPHSQWNVPFIPMSHCRQKLGSRWRGMKHLGAVSAEIITHPRS